MRAVVHQRFGPPEVLRLEDVPRPEPADGEVLVRVVATSVTRGDCHNRSGKPFFTRALSGWRRPKRPILGQEFAGEVAAVGGAITEFAVGDRVFGALPTLATRAGTWAEFVAIPEAFSLTQMPGGLSFEEAGCICDGFLCALNVLKPVEVGPETEMLVYGASGAIGTASVQLAKHYGAHVTAVCNTKNVELVRSLGADEVLDYTRGEDFTKTGKTYDVVVDAVGKHSFRRSRHALKPGGVYLPTDGLRNVVLWLWTKRFSDKQVRFEIPRYKKEYVVLLKDLVEAGEYTPVIDRSYPLEEVVEASRYVETQQKTGNVALTVEGGTDVRPG
jgi:NADPH:quinone reductase-like Zn-dependent oxidoreductase